MGYGKIYDTELKEKYPYYDCDTPNCKDYVLVKQEGATCSPCFDKKYPEIKGNDGKI